VIVDAHAHVYRKPPGHHTPYPIEDYLEELDRHSVGGALLVQPSFFGTDHSELIAAIAVAPSRLRGVGVADESFTREEMLRLHAAGVRGLRFNFFKGNAADLSTPAWRRIIEMIEPHGWHLELNVRDEGMPYVLETVAGLSIPLTVDHLGRPDPALKAGSPGFRALVTAARTQTIYVKLTAPFRITLAAAQDCLDAWLNDIGAHRVLWGSDSPWVDAKEQTPRYAQTLQWLEGRIASEDDRRAVLGLNSRALFGFDAP
jgi:predicted TIM-barrel fold metal-dependent hydrolase